MSRIIHENIFRDLINGISDAVNKNPLSRIIWCGENVWLYRILEILDSVGIKVSAVIDNSPHKIGVKTELYEIYEFDYAKDKAESTIFLMCSARSREMVAQLVSYGVKKDNIYIFKPIEYIVQKFERDFDYEMYDKELISHKTHQTILFELLVHFKDFCDKNKLRYYLYDGTLIGAVRHKGFIPWDDDIDVVMPFNDYIRLMQIYRDNDKYSLISWNRDDNYEFSWGKLIDNRTRMLHPGNTIMGCYIDIFILGGYPSDNDLIERKWNQYKLIEKEWHRYYVLRDTCIEICDSRAYLFDSLYDCSYEDAEYIGVMRTERQKAWVAPKEWFENVIELNFCGEKFIAPAGYDPYLRMKYGNYMTVPDVDKRDMHGFRAYKLL